MRHIKILPILMAFAFGAISMLAMFIVPTQVEAALSPKAKCERRVKIINNRGKSMAKKSKSLQQRYKKANTGWKNKISVNKKYAAKYANEPRLVPQVNELNGDINQFKEATKTYNTTKRAYIAERNSQIKTYKHFKANCDTAPGRGAARDKIKARTNDAKVLKQKATAVTGIYKSKVRPAILAMREARTKLASDRGTITQVALASPTEVEGSLAPEDLEIDEEADDVFDNEEFLSEDSNVEEPVEPLEPAAATPAS